MSGKSRAPLLEWTSAGLGLAVIIALLAILLLDSAKAPEDRIPDLSVTVDQLVPTRSGMAARFVISNASGQTASRVQVEGKAGGESATATVDYVPGRSDAKGVLLFSSATASPPTVRVTGFELP
ncbi:hypothetical protein [Sphingomonas xanthus]|uniref:TIGR02588 family protein n=1 Tax=Sphingomonas xanthus TaxID=2594473 RepID=A0A516IQ78_9SPHN|nr:hypothetical protein [Sphingomonas xanthus]QDP19071.1 hypothetical protein FMM02_03305 [Sphingomonas xanthus]